VQELCDAQVACFFLRATHDCLVSKFDSQQGALNMPAEMRYK